MKYDFLIVGAGLFGAVFAREAKSKGKTSLVIDKRAHVAGNAFTENIDGIQVHKYGAHIFHTNEKKIWEYVNQFAEFNNYINSPLARIGDDLFNLPFNMNTFYKLWGVTTPAEAKAKIEQQRIIYEEPKNLEEQALFLVGGDIYEKFIKGYTEKQWGRSCTDLPADIIKRIPLRFTFDNNYFNDRYQGIPIGGYTQMVKNMLDGCEVLLDTDYFDFVKQNPDAAAVTIYTGTIDGFFDYCFGALEYRSLHFETEKLSQENFQGNAVVNYTSREIPFTRIIEHKHFEFGNQNHTIITREFPASRNKNQEPYYPINDEKNTALYQRYKKLADNRKDVFFGGRLGQYAYFDMDKVIASALKMTNDF
ncbi:MAG: UDP-galactopyranose mutase [Defluviitaleaceae bacterium]|nr:UDP-galactopyranose mutase [Defluviitaleaceae bacterium]